MHTLSYFLAVNQWNGQLHVGLWCSCFLEILPAWKTLTVTVPEMCSFLYDKSEIKSV